MTRATSGTPGVGADRTVFHRAHRRHRSASVRRALASALVLLLVATACSSGNDGAAPSSGRPNSETDAAAETLTTEPGGEYRIRLSAGSAVAQGEGEGAAGDDATVVEGTAIPDDRVDEVIGRLTPWDVPDETVDFNRPPESLAPPVANETILAPFPPPVEVPVEEVPVGPLEVLRFQPEGEVDVAPSMNVTFNQPMVPLATLEQLDELEVPVTITPEIPGRWQWIGTRTLRFEATSDLFDRLPMATEFTVEIPAGTTSQSGGVLAETVSWTFSTPAVQVQTIQPEGTSLPLQPIYFVRFDQRVDAAAALEAVTLSADDEPVQIRLATDEEIAGDDVVSELVGQTLEDRWIAFTPRAPLAPDTPLKVEVGPGVPSAEGPRTSDVVETLRGATYAPMKIIRSTCGTPCVPLTPLTIEFNNQIDGDVFDDSMISIEPELPGARIGVYGNVVEIRGLTEGQTDYEVTVDASLADVFGQSLGDDETVTFKVGDAQPQLHALNRDLVTLDPLGGEQTLAITSINHDELFVRVFRVDPDQFPSFRPYLWRSDELVDDEGRVEPAEGWEQVIDTTVAVEGDDNRIAETLVDLREVLNGGPGHVIVVVETVERYPNTSELFWMNRPIIAWVQATTIGIDSWSDENDMVVRTTDLRDGAPIVGADVRLTGADITATTDADGVARAVLPTYEDIEGPSRDGGQALIANAGGETAILSDSFGEGWVNYGEGQDSAQWYVIDDRQVYRPGETASVKGWVRRLTRSTDGQLVLFDGSPTVKWTAHDGQGVEIATGVAEVSSLGGFDFAVELPAGANLGYAYLDLQLRGISDLPGQGFGHQFLIDEFRRPEFEVTARPESPGPYLHATPITAAVDAVYFAGGALPDAHVRWTVTTNQANYSPPDWEDWTFGEWIPWWFEGEPGFARGVGDFSEDCCFPPVEPIAVEQFSGRTNAEGTHYLRIDVDGDDVDLPRALSAEAVVTDVNRQSFASSTDLLVHAADVYVGLRSERVFVRAGDPLDIGVVVTDIDGAPVAGRRVSVEAARLEWAYEDGEWAEVPVDVQTCELTSVVEPDSCEFETPVGGQYRVTAVVTDEAGRTNRTQLTRWVAGGDARPERNVALESLTLVPDAETYQPGDTAEILVQAPFAEGEGLLTVTRNGIVRTQPFQVVDNAAVLGIDIADGDIPGIGIQVDVVGATMRTADDGTPLPDAPLRPAFAAASLELSVPPTSRTLDVEAVPVDEFAAPGADTAVDLTVTDANGDPVAGAELAVVVVDEAVLALSGYQLANPLDVFYQPLPTYLRTAYGRLGILLDDPLRLLGDESEREAADGGDAVEEAADSATAESAGGEIAPQATPSPANGRFDFAASDSDDGSAGEPVAVRTDFDALATFVPEVTTDADGTARIDVPLPDSLTRYRVMVVAVDGDDHFGSSEANITAQLPLMVRPSAPRFLNFGDTFELPVVVQNRTDADLEVDVVVEVANLELTEGAGRTITVPANDRVEVRFPAAAAEVGTARFRTIAVTGNDEDGLADAAAGELPVYTPATAEAFATYGVLDEGAVLQPLLAPEGVFPQFGGLEVTTSSTALASLTDAVLYLHEYRYDSVDAYASRIMAVASLRDILTAFAAEGLPAPAELEASVARDIEAMVELQNPDGGFASWRPGLASEPYQSVQAIHALVLAGDEGYEVPAQSRNSGLRYLADIENRFPPEYDQSTRDTITAYALHVRNLADDRDAAGAAALYDRAGDSLGLDAIAWLWPVLDSEGIDDEIETLFANRATETAGAATFTTDYGEQAYLLLYSDRRTDGIILDALLSERPESGLIPKVVAGLLANQKRGRWDNVQENSFILLAMKQYFDTFESVTPDFVARVWLGDLYAAEHEFEGRSPDGRETVVPMAELVAQGDSDLIIGHEGTGRLYYRLGLRYAPEDLELGALDRGFVVARTYEAIDDPDDVRRDADGTWRIRAGASVRVRLTMVADSRRTNMALIDPLPAGLETQSPALATTPDVPVEPEQEPPVEGDFGDGESFAQPDVAYEGVAGSIWWGPWFDHQNQRDDRTEAFAGLLGAGSYDFTYIARATTPGVFVVPPARAEEIYAPETFGRSASDTVIIEG